MEYRVAAFKCKVNSVIELSDDMIPVGSFYDPPDLYVICLEPLEEKTLPEEEQGSGVVKEQTASVEEEQTKVPEEPHGD